MKANATVRIPRPEGESMEHTRSQFGFLARSCKDFDNGSTAEAQRIATALRILLYKSRTSHPLLEQCGVMERLWIFDSAGDLRADDVTSVFNLVGVHMEVDGGGYLAGVSYIPKFDESKTEQPNTAYQVHELIEGRKAPRAPGFHFRIADWWKATVIRDSHGNEFSREFLVAAVANSDGGAHVDPSLEEKYYALSRLNSASIHASGNPSNMSIAFGPKPADDGESAFMALGSPVPASIRQIAWELIRSVRARFPELLPDEVAKAGL